MAAEALSYAHPRGEASERDFREWRGRQQYRDAARKSEGQRECTFHESALINLCGRV
jgi:hypothetical protein